MLKSGAEIAASRLADAGATAGVEPVVGGAASKAAGKSYLRAPSGAIKTGPEHVQDVQNRPEPGVSERMRQLAKRSHESRRRNKERGPREAIQEAMRKQIAERPDAVVEALLKSPRGVEVLLAHAAGIFTDPASRKEPTLIVLQSAFRAERRDHEKVRQWLQLLRERNFRQLEAELEVHAQLEPESGEAA